MLSFRRCSRKLFSLAFTLQIGFALQPSAALFGADGELQVELRCKILPNRADRGYKLWKVDLRKATGEPLRQAVEAGGGTVRFKNLQPAIYLVCLSGDKNRSRCQSVDLVPPPNQRTPVFEKSFEVPPQVTNRADAHGVSASRLGVPEKARREMLRSEEAQLRGDSEGAIRHLQRAVEIYSKYTEALNNLGTHYHRAGNYTRSIEYFSKVTQLDPRFFAGWVNLGGSLLAAGRFESALEANRKAVELRPDEALANSQLGMNYFYLRKFPEAKTYFEKVVSLDPSSAKSPQLFLAHIAFAERRPDEAEHQIRRYLELHPNSPQAASLRQTLQNLASTGSLKSPENSQSPP
jgi:tetratricopeptide (TPR) repeat protein